MGVFFSTSHRLSRRCFIRQRNSFPRRQTAMWMTWTHRTHSGAGSTWRNVGSGTCFRYPAPSVTGKGSLVYRVILMESWKEPALMGTRVARSPCPPLTVTSEAVVSLDREHVWVMDSGLIWWKQGGKSWSVFRTCSGYHVRYGMLLCVLTTALRRMALLRLCQRTGTQESVLLVPTHGVAKA